MERREVADALRRAAGAGAGVVDRELRRKAWVYESDAFVGGEGVRVGPPGGKGLAGGGRPVLRGQYASMGLLTDREAYLSYLERQMDSVRACLLAQEGVSARVEQVASMVVSVEERLLSLARMVKLMQSYAEGQDEEQRKFRQALIKKVKQMEERFVAKSEENLRVATERMERRMEAVQAAMLKRAEEVIKERVDRMVEDVVVAGQRELAGAMERGMGEIRDKISASNASESVMLRKAVGHLRTLIETEERNRDLMRKDMERLCYDTAAKAAKAGEDAARECLAQTHRALEQHGVGIPGIAPVGPAQGLTLDPTKLPAGYAPAAREQEREPRPAPQGGPRAPGKPPLAGGSSRVFAEAVASRQGGHTAEMPTHSRTVNVSAGETTVAQGAERGQRNLQALYQQLTDLEVAELDAGGPKK